MMLMMIVMRMAIRTEWQSRDGVFAGELKPDHFSSYCVSRNFYKASDDEGSEDYNACDDTGNQDRDRVFAGVLGRMKKG